MDATSHMAKLDQGKGAGTKGAARTSPHLAYWLKTFSFSHSLFQIPFSDFCLLFKIIKKKKFPRPLWMTA